MSVKVLELVFTVEDRHGKSMEGLTDSCDGERGGCCDIDPSDNLLWLVVFKQASDYFHLNFIGERC